MFAMGSSSSSFSWLASSVSVAPLLFVYRRGVMSDGCRELEEYNATEISTKGQPDFFDGGDYLCSQWASYGVFNYVLEKLARLIHGNNQITSLGAAIGPHNCGPRLNLRLLISNCTSGLTRLD
ncbi:unnamed protein product [Fraxinus pennsylvanica]|uniref:Uncharacterized protein n=1 Tax=Fraxinus pennsylvanica TaxID=56036 RepID=A0AAD2AAN7_9LAMI|nr:unnamed protein product [Fraxinus pennsylvanica]